MSSDMICEDCKESLEVRLKMHIFCNYKKQYELREHFCMKFLRKDSQKMILKKVFHEK